MRNPTQRLGQAFGLDVLPYVPRATLAQKVPPYTGRVLAEVHQINSGAAASSHGQTARHTAAGAVSGSTAPAAFSSDHRWRGAADDIGTVLAVLALGALGYVLLVLA